MKFERDEKMGNLIGSDCILCEWGSSHNVFRVDEIGFDTANVGERTQVRALLTYCPEKRSMPGLEIAARRVNFRTSELTATKVIFNPPATIVYWTDKTRTVVKCGENDVFDREKGLALCYMKKALGNTSRRLNDALKAADEGKEG